VLAAGSVVLVVVTAYYAWQNHKMVDMMKRQVDLAESTERNRARDAHILAAVIVHAGPLTYANPQHMMELEITNPNDSVPVLTPRLVVRAPKDPVAGPYWETPAGATEKTIEISDALMPGKTATFRGTIYDLIPIAEWKPGKPPIWPEQLIYDIRTTGVLGQSVLQRYEYRPTPQDGVFVRLRVVEITPNVEGSEPLRITTDTVSR
jgi:hypothetical protein